MIPSESKQKLVGPKVPEEDGVAYRADYRRKPLSAFLPGIRRGNIKRRFKRGGVSAVVLNPLQFFWVDVNDIPKTYYSKFLSSMTYGSGQRSQSFRFMVDVPKVFSTVWSQHGSINRLVAQRGGGFIGCCELLPQTVSGFLRAAFLSALR